MWYIYTMAIKRKEVSIHATTWKKLENIMLSERSQSQEKLTYYLILFIGNTQSGQIHKNRK